MKLGHTPNASCELMTRNISGDSQIVGPVLQFALFIVPIVMNGFFSVYSLTGWILTGRDKANWALEAPSVALYVCVGMLIFCALVLLFTRWRGGTIRHVLSISSIAHSIVVVLLTLSVYIAVRA